jgi:hypothetical protein
MTVWIEVKPGCCIICDDPIPPPKRKRRPSEKQDPRPRRTCGDLECQRVHQNLLAAEWRARQPRAPVRKPMPADAVPAPGEGA